MHRLQADRDLELAAKQLAKAQAGIADERGVVLNNQPLEAIGALRDGRIVRGRNCLGIEKTAAVIEFELARGPQIEKRVIDLCRDSSQRYCLAKRIAPQVAHQTAERAFSIGEKDGGNRIDCAANGTFLFDEIQVGKIRIADLPRRAAAEYPGIAFRRFGRIYVHEYKDRNFRRYSASRKGRAECMVASETAPCWKRRLGKTGIAKPVTDFTPRATISPFS